MSGLKPIITSRNLELGDNFDDIVNRIRSNERYKDLKRLCRFYPEENRFEYCTEGIYPDHSKYPDRLPILFLFSNPHPKSVESGLFLSESHSRTFWQRLFESCYFSLQDDNIDLTFSSASTTKALGQLMLNGRYDSKFLLYFHCLWPIPTNHVSDLKRLFPIKSLLWRKIKEDSAQELSGLLEAEKIKYIIVFSGPVFHEVTLVSKADYTGRRDKIKGAVDDFLKDGDTAKYYGRLCFYHAKAEFSSNVEVYLSLDTRSTNMGKEMGKRPFTTVLDMILENILESSRAT